MHRQDQLHLWGAVRGLQQSLFWSFRLSVWSSESIGVFTHVPAPGGISSSPYDCRLRENFHCWLRLWLQTSTVSPPILALRLSRQRLLPTWRSLALDSICSHFWWPPMIHRKKIKRMLVIRVQLCSAPVLQTRTCLLSFSRQPCSLMREPAVLSTTVRHKSMCLTDLSLVRAHSLNKEAKH